jgi:hypothetical protein
VNALTDLTKEELKGKNFQWSTQPKAAFDQLNISFTIALILQYFDPQLSTVVETVPSVFAISAILL